MGPVAGLEGGDVGWIVRLELVERDRRAGPRVPEGVQAGKAIGGGDLISGIGIVDGRPRRSRGARLRAAGDDARARPRPPGGALGLTRAVAARMDELRPASRGAVKPDDRLDGSGYPGVEGRRGARHDRAAAVGDDPAQREREGPFELGGGGGDGDREPAGARRPEAQAACSQPGADPGHPRGGRAEASPKLLGCEEVAVIGPAGRRDRLGVGGQGSRVARLERHPDAEPQP